MNIRTISLPLTSIYTNNEENALQYRFEFTICERTNRLYTKKIEENPLTRYKHKWMTCFEPENHLDNVSEEIDKCLTSTGKIVGVSFKDDTLIARLKKYGYQTKTSSEVGLSQTGACIYKLMNEREIAEIGSKLKEKEKADLVVARHILEHSQNPAQLLKDINKLAKSDGKILIEIPDCKHMLENNLHTMIWEEHISYFTEHSLVQFLQVEGYEIIKLLRFENVLEDSLVALITKSRNVEKTITANGSNINNKEAELYRRFFSTIESTKNKLVDFTKACIKNEREIFIFGAGHHAASFVNIYGLEGYVKFCLDDNENKAGKFLPGSKIKIVSSDKIQHSKSPVVIMTNNPETQDKIKKKLGSLKEDVRCVSAFEPDEWVLQTIV